MFQRIDRRFFIKQSVALLVASALRSAGGATSTAAAGAGKDWRYYGGDPGTMRYSVLDQINHSNVHNLRVAWTYHTGDAMKRPRTTIECTPIVVDGIMYITTAQIKACALDATSGALLWQFDPFAALLGARGATATVEGAASPRGVNRGVTYWRDGKDKRILFTALDRLICLDAETGKPVSSFGENGAVDLTKGLGRDISGLLYDVTSPGGIYKDLIILGAENGEGPDPAAPGHVRAFDVRTGKQVWIFHTIPGSGEFGQGTWESNSWKSGQAANDWGGLSIDETRGWAFLATGSAAYDYFGGQRPGQDLFANCVIALEAATGKRMWHYQVVHHDLWDRDLPCPPCLITLNQNGRRVDAVAQNTKFGRVFVFNRETGAPLFPIEERPVPASDVPGEKTWPTQPVPLRPPPYTRQIFTADDITDISSDAHADALEVFNKVRTGNEWLPPSLQGTLEFPGLDGGTDWGGGSFDPGTGWYYVNSHDEPWIIELQSAPAGLGYPYMGAEGEGRFVDREGYAAIKPPWGQLTAIDLNRGEIAWQVVLGEHKELTARGIPPTGTQNMGGSVVTAGGLLFIGATQDEKFRAFDKSTGKILWEADLPAGGYASPATYEAKGKQYVVIAAGGGGKPRTKAGDALVAFALP